MALVFIGIDPDTPGGNCPSVWIDPADNSLVIQGDEITDPSALAEIAARSPILDREAIVKLPPRMIPIVRKALETWETRSAGTDVR